MTVAIDITKEQRKALLILLRRFIPGVAVWAYGSRVKWTARPNSDLDLVVFTTPEQLPLVSELKDELAESSNIPFLVDLHVWDEIPERFREIIRKEYVVVQEAKENLGQTIPEKWRRTTWGEEISLEYGKALRGYEKAIGRIRVYGTNGPVGWTTQPLAPGPGVILGRKGAYRGVNYSADPFFVIDTAYYVIPKTALDMRWLYYAIRHYKLGEINDGSPIPSTTRAAVYVMGLVVPPLYEQRAIAAVLGALDDKIESNRRTSRALERVARAIFRAWFVDFEPVKAKADGAHSFPGMPQEVFDSLPTRLVVSEMGLVPEGWGARALSSVCTLISGGTPKRSEPSYWNGEADIPWYSVRDVPGDGMVWVLDTVESITQKGLENSAAQVVPKGCTIISARGTVGKLAMVGRPMAFNQSCYGLLPNDHSSFSYLYLLTRTLISNLQQRTHGSVFETITRATFDGLLVITPPDDLISSFETVVAPLFDKLLASLQESAKLTEMRDYLLPKLLSGEVWVSGDSAYTILETTCT